VTKAAKQDHFIILDKNRDRSQGLDFRGLKGGILLTTTSRRNFLTYSLGNLVIELPTVKVQRSLDCREEAERIIDPLRQRGAVQLGAKKTEKVPT
jgi:hypothetical protein